MIVKASSAYAGRCRSRPRYYANGHSRDALDAVTVEMDIENARGRGMTLDEAGFALVAHRSAGFQLRRQLLQTAISNDLGRTPSNPVEVD